MSNQQYNTKSMSGLSDTYSNNIFCDTLDVADAFTCEPGCIITLPTASIQDSYLSNNVAFRNQANTFSLANTFTNTVQFTSTTIPVITQSIPANDATTKISTTQWVDTYFGKLTLATGATIQTWFGQNRFSSSGANLPVLLRNTDQPTYNGGMFIVNAGGSYNPGTLLGDTCVLSTGIGGIDTGGLSLTTWSSTNCGIRITLNDVRINGSTSSINSACSFTNATTPVITQAISLADNSTKISTTAFVKGQNYITSSALTPYALLVGPQTFSGDQNFATQSTPDNSTLCATTAFVKNQNYITSTALTPYALLAPTALQIFAGTAQNTFNNQVNVNAGVRFVDSFTSKISQSGNALIIENISNLNSVQIRSTTSGLVQRTGLLIENGITCTLQGGSGNTITITGVNTPTLGIPPLAGVYSSEIATTSWVNTELTGVYARLNPTALQTWGTNENQFNTQLTMNAVSTRYLNGVNSSSITQTGNNLILANVSNSNSIQLRTNSSGGVFSQNVLCRNGNEIAIKGDVGIIRVLNNDATIECGTFSSQAPYNCGYLTIGAPITSKTNFNIGYQWQIGGAAFTGTAWATAIVAYNIQTLVWDGSGDKTLGVWQVDIVIVTNCTTAPNFSLCWNTISNTSMDITEKCALSTSAALFNATAQQITRLSFVLNITNFLQTFWLNSLKAGGAGLSSNTSFSQIKFTRIG